MYVWISDYIISKQDMMAEDNQALTDLTGLFINIIKFYRVVFDDRKNCDKQVNEEEWEIKAHYLKSLAEFLMFTSNDVVSTKYPQTHQEVGKDTLNYL